MVCRLVADRLAKVWKQPVLIDNRPGGAQLIATQAAAAATADGYTLYFAQASTFTIVPYVGPATPLDPMLAFVPIAFVAEIPLGFAVDAMRGKKSLAELIEFAANNPDRLDVGTGLGGGFNNLAGEMFARRAGIRVHIVPYRTGADGGPSRRPARHGRHWCRRFSGAGGRWKIAPACGNFGPPTPALPRRTHGARIRSRVRCRRLVCAVRPEQNPNGPDPAHS